MAFCTECGTELDKDGICPKCASQEENQNPDGIIGKAAKKFEDAPDHTETIDNEDIKDNLFFAILAYFGILILIPIICRPNSKYSKFHSNQSLNLIIFLLIYTIIAVIVTCICFSASYAFGMLLLAIFLLINIFPFVLWIWGIYNAASGKAKQLPLIGKIHILD